MKSFRRAVSHASFAALLVLSAAIFATAQTGPLRKENAREVETGLSSPPKQESQSPAANPKIETENLPKRLSNRTDPTYAEYSYEFTQSEFQLSHVLIEHNSEGGGKITFERRNNDPIVDPLDLSPATVERLKTLWQALRFMESTTSYQSEKQYPHLGTMRLQMKQNSRERVAEFNWTRDKDAFALVTEYKRIANQAIFIFDITLARENQPLEAPKLMDQLDAYVRRNDLADARQLIPLLRDLCTDERIPLMSRNSAARILKKLDR